MNILKFYTFNKLMLQILQKVVNTKMKIGSDDSY